MEGIMLLVGVALWKEYCCWWEWLYGRNDVVGGSGSMEGMTLLVGVALWKE